MELKSFDRGIPLHGLSRKLLLIMKLTTFIMIIALAQVSAKGLAQKITLNTKNTPIEKVLQSIREQSGFGIIYETNDLKNETVSLNLTNATIDEAMQQIIKGLPYTFEIVKNTVVLNRRQPGFLEKIVKRFQNINVQGVVKDEHGSPLSGATIKVKGTAFATTTNTQGEFTLNNVPEAALLQISFIGYKTKEIVAKSYLMEVRLELASTDLSEITINKGYYKENKQLSAGSVSSISAEAIERRPAPNVLTSLQGAIPGLEIVPISGIPGGGFSTIKIRGTNSISSGTAPLLLIDGVPTNINLNQLYNPAGTLNTLNSLNPSDVEDITVLKDADATAIYGSRGANGVILITTKKGKPNSITTSFSIYSGISSNAIITPYLSTEDYLNIRREAFKNDNVVPNSTNAPDLTVWDKNIDHRWSNELTGKTTNYTNAQLQIAGGTDNTTYLLRYGFNHQTPPFDGGYRENRNSILVNLNNISNNKKFTLGFTGNFSINNNNLPGFNPASLISLPPNIPDLRNADGSLNWIDGVYNNPYAATLQKYNSKVKNYNASAIAKYAFSKNFDFQINAGITNNDLNEKLIKPSSSLNPIFSEPAATGQVRASADTWNIEPQINWNKNFSKSYLSALLGATYQESLNESDALDATGYSSDAGLDDIVNATNFRPTYSYSKYHYQAVYARIGYQYDGKYSINITGRQDGSSRFGSKNRFANFGSIGGAWIFSKENLIANNLKWLSIGKLKASYGITGNDQIGDYRYLETYSTNSRSYLNVSAINPTRLANENYGWEQTKKLNIGMELGFFKDRALLSVDRYINRSSNLLISYPLSRLTGFNIIQANLPALVENSGYEFSATFQVFNGSKFQWQTALNFTIPTNKLVRYEGDLDNSAFRYTLKVGQPVDGGNRVFKFDGVNPTTGLYQFRLANGTLTSSYPSSALLNSTEFVSLNPKFFGGFSSNLSYGNFGLNFLIQASRKMGRNNIYTSQIGTFGMNYLSVIEDRWQKAGDIASLQMVSQNPSGAAASAQLAVQYSDQVYKDIFFARLKNLELNYVFDKKHITRLKMQGLTMFLRAENIFTISNYKTGDPENPLSFIGAMRTTVFGLSATF